MTTDDLCTNCGHKRLFHYTFECTQCLAAIDGGTQTRPPCERFETYFPQQPAPQQAAATAPAEADTAIEEETKGEPPA